MHIGALFALGKEKPCSQRIIEHQDEWRKKVKSIWRVSVLLLIFSFPFWFYETYKMTSYSLAFGYGGGLYGVKAEIPGYVRVLSDYFEPALLCLYFCCEYFKKERFIVLVAIFITIIMPPLIVGGRSQAVIAISIVLIIYFLFHKMAVKKVLLLAIGAYIALTVLFLVKKTRNGIGATIETYAELLSQSESSPIISTISEMGHSLYPLAATMEIVPSRDDFRYGTTYLWGFSTLIPNIGFGKRHPGVVNANLGEWLMNREGLQFGPGYSLTAEGYINFGYLGFIFFFFYGFLLAKYCKYINKRYLYEKPFMIIVTIVFLWFSIKTVRNSFLGTVRAIFYIALPMYWAFWYYYNKHFRKHAIT
jgi:oligosaccharide repeat unit polymerase